MKTQEFNELVEKCQNLTHNQKLVLAGAIFHTGAEKDNYGQLLFYTGLKYGKNGRIRFLTPADCDCAVAESEWERIGESKRFPVFFCWACLARSLHIANRIPNAFCHNVFESHPSVSVASHTPPCNSQFSKPFLSMHVSWVWLLDCLVSSWIPKVSWLGWKLTRGEPLGFLPLDVELLPSCIGCPFCSHCKKLMR